jgi:ParB-like chromosome segregation protein Spo0J
MIAGERRLKATINFTPFKTIQAKIIQVDDLQARRISATENLQPQKIFNVKIFLPSKALRPSSKSLMLI